MEKRRRARINSSLSEIKSLLLEAIKKEGARHNKMEKADILEMAVKHLRQIQRQQVTDEASTSETEVSKYHLGFHACVQEVCKYLDANGGEDLDLKSKLLNHLANCMTNSSFQSLTSSSSSPTILPSSSSSSVTHVPLSPLSIGSPSPASMISSPQAPSSIRLDSSTLLQSPQQGKDLYRSDITNEVRSKGQVVSYDNDGIQRKKEEQNINNGVLQAVLASAAQTVLVKPQIVSLSSSGVLSQHATSRGESYNSEKFSSSNTSIGGARPSQVASVTEINNNSITLPTFLNVGPPTVTNIQQSHLQQAHLNQQQHQLQQVFPPAADGSHVIANLNPFQLIPTKTANGEIAFLLSTTGTNLLNHAQFPSLTIPVLAPNTVSHAQVLASPVPQQAIQIAVSYAQDEQRQPVAFISQPQFHPTTQCADISSILSFSQQTTPLNLSSTTHQGTQITRTQMPKSGTAFTTVSSSTSDNSYISSDQRLSAATLTNQAATSNGNTSCSLVTSTNSINSGNAELANQICSQVKLSLPSRETRAFLESSCLTPRSLQSFQTEPEKSGTDVAHPDSQEENSAGVSSMQPMLFSANKSAFETEAFYQHRQYFRPWKE